ncbi:S24 family peptidase [Sandaracinobacteroides hominis]|uniref:S24 family peptidase n=1 Tax=Sandaracinobacteroides hominis TaxID=2780086 RepID=UPI001F357B5A|nr:S24 family peptidase [Sandaracinobacteroides hominis]
MSEPTLHSVGAATVEPQMEHGQEPQRESSGESVQQLLDLLIQRSGTGYAEVSRLLGRNPAYIQQFIKRGIPRRLSETDRRILSAHFGVSEARLGGPPHASVSVSPDSARQPLLRVGFVDSRDPAVRPLDLDARFVRQLELSVIPGLSALQVEGDSMSPTLFAGDLILVDTHDCVSARDGIYAIESGPSLNIRRLSVHPVTRRIAILADNAAWPSFPDCDPAGVKIIGRVVWISRALP